MGFGDALNKINRRYAWSLFGVVLALAFGAVTLYTAFIRDSHPELRFHVVSNASVLDVREQLGDLEIIYDGLDIQKAEQSLRVVVVRVVNSGTEDILIGHYDERAPLGFSVTSGRLIRAELISASSAYLENNVGVTVIGSQSALFTPVILEEEEWFTIKSLILHPEGDEPRIVATGKIAGVQSLAIIDSTTGGGRPNFLAQVFSGQFWVQIVRATVYPIAFLLLMTVLALFIVVPIALISDYFQERKRRKHVLRFEASTTLELSKQDDYIFTQYVNRGTSFLKLLRDFSSSEELDHEVKRHEEGGKTWLAYRREFSDPQLRSRPFPLESVKNSGLITLQDDHWIADPHMLVTLEEFIKFLEVERLA